MLGRESLAQVYKRELVTGAGRYPDTPNFSWYCHATPLSKTLELSERLAKSSHYLLGEVANIDEGDKITIGSETFFVQGVETRKTPFKNPHHIEVYVSKRE